MDTTDNEIMVTAPSSPLSSQESDDIVFRDIPEIEIAAPSPSPSQASDYSDSNFPWTPPTPSLLSSPRVSMDGIEMSIPIDPDSADQPTNPQPLPPPSWTRRARIWWMNQWINHPCRIIGTVWGIILTFSVILLVIFALRKKDACEMQILVSKNEENGFRTISEALKASPNYSVSQICIIIKSGEYRESVFVGQEKTNILLKGDGMDRTIIVSNNGSSDGGTYKEQMATLWTKGKWFSAHDLSILKEGNSGVAVENWSDKSAFFNCKFKGSIRPLLTHAGGQFYRGCQVHGHDYLISGGADAYFQNTNFVAETIDPSQKIVFSSPLHINGMPLISGFKFHHCAFYMVSENVKDKSPGLLVDNLERPAAIAVIQCYMDERITYTAVGNATPNATTILAFDNNGSGAAMDKLSPIVRKINDLRAASKFSLRNFLEVKQWQLSKIDYDMDITM